MTSPKTNLKAFQLFEANVGYLQELAKKSPTESPHYRALEVASMALLYAVNRHPSEFLEFLENAHSELTAEEAHKLRELGISPKSSLKQSADQNGAIPEEP